MEQKENRQQNKRKQQSILEEFHKPLFIASLPFMGYLCSYIYQYGKLQNYNLPFIFIKVTLESAVISSLIVGTIAATLLVGGQLFLRYKKWNKNFNLSYILSIFLIIILMNYKLSDIGDFLLILILIPFLIFSVMRLCLLGYLVVSYLKQNRKGREIRFIKGHKSRYKAINFCINIILVFATFLLRHPYWIFPSHKHKVSTSTVVSSVKRAVKSDVRDYKKMFSNTYLPYVLFLSIIIGSAGVSSFLGYYLATHKANYLISDPDSCLSPVKPSPVKSKTGKPQSSPSHNQCLFYAVISGYDNYLLTEEIDEVHKKPTGKISFLPINENAALQVVNLPYANNKADKWFTHLYDFMSDHYISILAWLRGGRI